MYQLIGIAEDAATRFVQLKDTESGLVEECFDDSALVSNINFDFMKVGEEYECKIKLFGNPVAQPDHESVICRMINCGVTIGQTKMTEVQVGNQVYYIPRKKVRAYLDGDIFSFHFTRKDLIQVNDIIHPDLI